MVRSRSRCSEVARIECPRCHVLRVPGMIENLKSEIFTCFSQGLELVAYCNGCLGCSSRRCIPTTCVVIFSRSEAAPGVEVPGSCGQAPVAKPICKAPPHKAMTFIGDIERKDKGDLDECKDNGNRWGKDACKSDWWESDWWKSDWWESGRWESSCPDNRWGKDDSRWVGVGHLLDVGR